MEIGTGEGVYLGVFYKLFTKVITARISDCLDSNQPGYQAGFRSGFSTTDHIHTFTQIRENINEYREPLCMAFIDYEKAFDSVQIPAVLEDVRRRVVEKVYCKILQDIYRGEAATIKIHMEADKILI
nr:uncharacterized protein LOC113824512 [Penaeus vannamei]